MKIRCILLSALTTCAVLFATVTPAAAATQVIDIEWKDANRERELPLKIRVPDGADSVPLLIFSAWAGRLARRRQSVGRALVCKRLLRSICTFWAAMKHCGKAPEKARQAAPCARRDCGATPRARG